MSFRMSDTSLLSKTSVCLICVCVCMFGIARHKLRIRRYRPCCADEAVHTSWLRKLTEANFKNNNRESGGSNCENKNKKIKPSKQTVTVLCCCYVYPTHLQVLVRCDPVTPNSQQTNDVMFVRKELHLFWLFLLQANFIQTHNIVSALIYRACGCCPMYT